MTLTTFDSFAYGAAVASLLAPREMAVGPGRPEHAVAQQLRRLDAEAMFAPRRVRDREMARACLAGLWLYHDFLDESHTLSQCIDTPSGSYWHAIIHRREGDFANSKYWFRRVGEHAVFTPLQQAVAGLAGQAPAEAAAQLAVTQTNWDPLRFVDLCETVVRGRSAAEPLCRAIQIYEWQFLFDYCYRRAVE